VELGFARAGDVVGGFAAWREDFPELAELIERRYRPVAQFGTIATHEIQP
jgi:hypothetical protein